MSRPNPINPQRVFWELSPRLPDGAILTADSGSAANWYARDLQAARRDDGLALGQARDDGRRRAVRDRGQVRVSATRPVIALRRRRRDADERHHRADHDRQVPRAVERSSGSIVMVLNNRDLNMVTWEQRAMEGDPKFEGSQDLPDVPYAQLRRDARADGIRVDDARATSARPGTRR